MPKHIWLGLALLLVGCRPATSTPSVPPPADTPVEGRLFLILSLGFSSRNSTPGASEKVQILSEVKGIRQIGFC